GVPEAAITKAFTMRGVVPEFLDACARDVLATGARVVGFTTSFSQNLAALALSRLLKQRAPGIRVVFGGANCDGPMGAALHRSFPWVDVVVRGEGGRGLPQLVDYLLDGGPIRPQPGLCYREDGRPVAIDQSAAGMVPMDDVPR